MQRQLEIDRFAWLMKSQVRGSAAEVQPERSWPGRPVSGGCCVWAALGLRVQATLPRGSPGVRTSVMAQALHAESLLRTPSLLR